MTEHSDEQENKTRLLHDFHYAALGGRCRTATYINPNLVDLGQYEWLEAECADGRGWDLKVMKAAPALGYDDELQIQQIYLEECRHMNFGAMVLKLTSYQKAQESIGYIIDANDSGNIAGARLFRDLAEEQGIVFNMADEPVAPEYGLITKPGVYLSRAFNIAAANPKNMPMAPLSLVTEGAPEGHIQAVVAAPQNNLTLPAIPVGSALSARDRKHISECMIALNRAVDIVVSKGMNNPLYCDDRQKLIEVPRYKVFVSLFEELILPLRQNKANFPPFSLLKPHLDSFTYQAFRIVGRHMKADFERGLTKYKDKKVNAMLDDARQRCSIALERVSRGASSKVFDLFAYDEGDIEAQKVNDLAELRGIVTRILAQLQGEGPAPAAGVRGEIPRPVLP